MARTFLQLLDSIKREARLKASEDLDDWIKDIINQEYQLLVENAEYSQLYVPFAAIAITSDAQSIYTLPVGLRKIKEVEFAPDSADPVWRPLQARNGFNVSLTKGNPYWYFQAGNNLHIYPYSSILSASMLLRVSYIKYPTTLVADGDVIDVTELEPVLIKKVLARVLRYHKSQETGNVAAEAQMAENKVV